MSQKVSLGVTSHQCLVHVLELALALTRFSREDTIGEDFFSLKSTR